MTRNYINSSNKPQSIRYFLRPQLSIAFCPERKHKNMQLDPGRMQDFIFPAFGLFGCPNCNWVFSSITTLEIHINKVSTMCDLCGKQCCSEFNLENHKTIVCDLANNCPLCDKPVTTLRMHFQMEHNGSKNFPCLNCGKKFQRKCEVYRHNSRVHLGIRDHPCDICGKRFGDNKDMMRHRNAVHKGKKIDTSKWKQKVKRTKNRKININVKLEDGSEVGCGQLIEDEQGQAVYMQQQGQGACKSMYIQEQRHFDRPDGSMQGFSGYLQGQEGGLQSDYKEELGQGLHMTESNNQTKQDSLSKKEVLEQTNAVQQSHDFLPVTEKYEILPISLKPESKRPAKSETHPNENNIEEQEDNVSVMAHEEPVKCNLCSSECINIDALEVHKNTTHGPKCHHCNFRFKDNEKLKKHITVGHKDLLDKQFLFFPSERV